MGAFMIIQADISDPARFMDYARRTPALVEKFGGRYRSIRGETAQLEGAADHRRIVVSEWPSIDAARQFWDSPEYAELKKLREGAADVHVYIVEITGD